METKTIAKGALILNYNEIKILKGILVCLKAGEKLDTNQIKFIDRLKLNLDVLKEDVELNNL